MIVHLNPGPAPDGIGGKGAMWWRTLGLGLAVPDGFVIPANHVPLLEALNEALQALVQRTGCDSVAVRSSGGTEDGRERALAGLFKSVLHVPLDASAVLEAVACSRRSALSRRARAASAIEDCPAILVQEMVHPGWSGLLFSRDPRNGEDAPIIELVQGHLGKLVAGEEPELRATLTPEAHKRVAQKLSEECLLKLLQAARLLEADLDSPVDIEWAVTDAQLVILQARPMTASPVINAKQGIELIPVERASAAHLPQVVRQHDKISLRLLADELGIPISSGLVALCFRPSAADMNMVATTVSGWGEFIAVLLSPFRWHDDILRHFGTGDAALSCIEQFVGKLSSYEQPFAFLLKELQPTVKTGIAVRLGDGQIRAEVIMGHFASKGIEDATFYRLDPTGVVLSRRVGQQTYMVTLENGRVEKRAVSEPAELDASQLRALTGIMNKLALHHPEAGIEFGYTPDGEFFLVDLYEGTAVTPPRSHDNVLCEGRVIGRVRYLEIDDAAIEDSIERHMHNRKRRKNAHAREAEILVVSRPFQVLDQLVYDAGPNTFGMVFMGGSVLCHLAVVMRECGIPGLLCADVRTIIRDGERALLDTRPGARVMLQRLSE